MESSGESVAEFELVPLLPLPQLDLGPSVKSRLPRIWLLQAVLRVLIASRLTAVGFIISIICTIAMYFTPVAIGKALGIAVAILSLPGTIVSLVVLRYEMVVTLAKTYDIWFFGIVSTISNVVLVVLFHDLRAIALVTVWLSFFVNVFIDASIVGLRSVWVANIFSLVSYVAAAGAITTHVTPGLYRINVLRFNGHELSAVALVRDGYLTLAVVIVRNIVRRFQMVTEARYLERVEGDDAHKRRVLHCVSFRCRLRLQATSTRRRTSSTARMPPQNTTTQLRHVPHVKSFNGLDTVLPRWLVDAIARQVSSSAVVWCHRGLYTLGIIGFVLNFAVFLVVLASTTRQTESWHYIAAGIGLLLTLIFTGVSIALSQRDLLRAVATSFDFMYIATQATVLELAVDDLTFRKPPSSIALLGIWLWIMWMLSHDALLPDARRRLGMPTRLVAWVCTALLLLMSATTVTMFLILPPHRLNDRVITTFRVSNHRIELRALSIFFSCAANIAAWGVRLLWRLWRAIDGELCVLDGPVVMDYQLPVRALVTRTLHGVVPIGPTNTQI